MEGSIFLINSRTVKVVSAETEGLVSCFETVKFRLESCLPFEYTANLVKSFALQRMRFQVDYLFIVLDIYATGNHLHDVLDL